MKVDSRGEGFFSYKMAVEPNKQMYLQVTYYGGDDILYSEGKKYTNATSSLIDGKLIANQKLTGSNPDGLIDVCYEIELAEGKKR
jgi:uncharacterized protein